MILIIADDLTGAADTGAAFARRWPTLLLLEPGPAADAGVLVLAVETRALPESAAAARAVRRAVEPLGRSAALVYKKIDSTLRGHPAAELAAVLESLGETRALIAPAFPGQGRTTLSGRVHLGGRPLEQTEFSRQVPTGDLLRVFAALNPALLPIEAVRQGETTIRSALRAARGPLVADAETEADLQSLARAGLADGLRVFCGSAGLAAALAEETPGPPPGPRPKRRGEIKNSFLAVAGSLHPASLAQVEFARRRGLAVVQPPEAFFDPGNEAGVEETAAALVQALRARGAAVLTTHPGGELNPAEIASRLAHAAALAIQQQPISGLFLTGGETARAVCAALGCTRLRLAGEVEPGIPASQLADGPWAGLPVVTKAGGFGGETALLNVLEFLKGNS